MPKCTVVVLYGPFNWTLKNRCKQKKSDTLEKQKWNEYLPCSTTLEVKSTFRVSWEQLELKNPSVAEEEEGELGVTRSSSVPARGKHPTSRATNMYRPTGAMVPAVWFSSSFKESVPFQLMHECGLKQVNVAQWSWGSWYRLDLELQEAWVTHGLRFHFFLRFLSIFVLQLRWSVKQHRENDGGHSSTQEDTKASKRGGSANCRLQIHRSLLPPLFTYRNKTLII